MTYPEWAQFALDLLTVVLLVVVILMGRTLRRAIRDVHAFEDKYLKRLKEYLTKVDRGGP